MSELSQPFLDMAARIERLDEAEFAGAVVIVPPGDGEQIVFLTADPTAVPAQFWSSLAARVERGAAKAQEAEQAAQPWAGVRR